MNLSNFILQPVGVILLALSVLFGSLPLAEAAPQYQMIPLDTFALPGQYPSGTAAAINDPGLIVGELNSYYDGNWVGSRAVRWQSPATPQSLGDLFGRPQEYSFSVALGVNAGGTAVGWSFGTLTGISGSPQVATWWGPLATTPTRLPDIVEVPDSSSNQAYSINDGGEAVGSTRSIFSGAFHAVYWPATNQPGHTLPNGSVASVVVHAERAADINNDGLIVGTGQAISEGQLFGTYRPMAWTPQKQAIVLKSPAGVSTEDFAGFALAINSAGNIAGHGQGSDSPLYARALRWTAFDTVPEVLEYAPLFGQSNGSNLVADMNDQGFVVGQTFKFNVGFQGVLWDEQGAAHLLDDLVINAPGYQFRRADGINNHNWITASALDPNGFERPVLLVPVPEPRSWVHLMAGGIAIRLSRGRQSRSSKQELGSAMESRRRAWPFNAAAANRPR